MDDNYVKENFDRTDKKLSYICTTLTELKIASELNKTNLENQQKGINTQLRAGKVVIIVAWTLLGVIGILVGNTLRQEFNYANSADFTHQQEINTINDRLLKLEVLNGSTPKQ